MALMMENLAELWAERQKRKVKPYSKYANAKRNNQEMSSKSGKRLNKNDPLTSKVYDLISPEIKLKLNKIQNESA